MGQGGVPLTPSPPHIEQLAKGSQRPTQPCVTTRPGLPTAVTPCAQEVPREAQQALPRPPSREKTRSVASDFVWVERELQVTQSLPPPLAWPWGHSPGPDRPISRGKDLTVHPPGPGPQSFFCLMVWPLPSLFVHSSRQAAPHLPRLGKASYTWNHKPGDL